MTSFKDTLGTKKLSHSKSSNFFGTKYFGHVLVWCKVLLVLGILKVMLLEIRPQLFDTFRTRCFFLANNCSKISRKLHWFCDSRLFLSLLLGTCFFCCFWCHC